MARMSPPGESPSLVIAVGHDGPRSSSGKMPAPGENAPQEGGKASAQDAGAVMSDAHCVDCANWHPDTGECDKVEGVWEPEAACVKFFTPLHDTDHDAEQEGPAGGDSDDNAAPDAGGAGG